MNLPLASTSSLAPSSQGQLFSLIQRTAAALQGYVPGTDSHALEIANSDAGDYTKGGVE